MIVNKIFKIKSCLEGKYEEEIIEEILENRGVEDIESFLNPSVEDIIDEPFVNADKAAQIIIDNVDKNKKVLIFADVDVDGATSGAIMVRYLKRIGYKDVDWTINDGKAHGTTDKLFSKVNEYKPNILIIVDSLDNGVDNYKLLNEMGIEIVVIDHHDVVEGVDYDKYVTLVTCNKGYENSLLSGSAVVWKFVQYVDSISFLELEPTTYSDLAMTGLVADMMDLSELSKENRAIVDMGLKNIENVALKKISGSFGFESSTVSFSVAPKINACNRMNSNELAMQTLLCDDAKEVGKLIRQLDKCRDAQNNCIDEVLNDATSQAEEQSNRNFLLLCVETEYNVCGLLANIIMSTYNKPTIVLNTIDNNLTGSGRGIGVSDFKEVCLSTGLFKCAGHPNAFGVRVSLEDVERASEALEEAMKDIVLVSESEVDAQVYSTDLTETFAKMVKNVNRISGEGFKPLTFSVVVDEYELSNMSQGKHLVLKTPNVWYIMWNFKGDWNALEEAEMLGTPIQCVGKITHGRMGRYYGTQMILDDFKILD